MSATHMANIAKAVLFFCLMSIFLHVRLNSCLLNDSVYGKVTVFRLNSAHNSVMHFLFFITFIHDNLCYYYAYNNKKIILHYLYILYYIISSYILLGGIDDRDFIHSFIHYILPLSFVDILLKDFSLSFFIV